MKKCMLFLTVFFFVTQAMAQNKMTELNVGFLGPSDAETGFWGGLNVGRMVDENIGMSFGLHIYRRTFTKNIKVGANAEATTYEESSTMIPLMIQVHYVGPISPALDLKITAGLGYEVLWNSVNDYKNKNEDSDSYTGFGWQLAAGVSMPISRAADFFGELFYHGGSPSSDAGTTVEGFPVRTEIDMSGLGLRIGLRLYSFGI